MKTESVFFLVLVMATVGCGVTTPTQPAGPDGIVRVPLGVEDWAINPESRNRTRLYRLGGGIGFSFPVSRLADPHAEGPWVGYLVRRWATPLTPEHALRITFRIQATGEPGFNYKSESGNVCDSPAKVRLHFQTGDLYNGEETTRWWANPEASTLSEELSGDSVTLSVSMDAARWSNTNGHFGDSSPWARRGFSNAMANPTWIGVTFGGGCYFGHGVNVTGGTAEFQVQDVSY